MPIASPEVYADMIDRAKAGKFAYPAINVTSSSSVNAAIQGFADAESDGIIQFSWGGAEFASGQRVKDMVIGAVAQATNLSWGMGVVAAAAFALALMSRRVRWD